MDPIKHFTAYSMILVGLLFYLGRGIVIGLDGREPYTIIFPEIEIVGLLFIIGGLIWLLPPWMAAKTIKLIKKLLILIYS